MWGQRELSNKDLVKKKSGNEGSDEAAKKEKQSEEAMCFDEQCC